MRKEKIEIPDGCLEHLRGVKDTLSLLDGKWKALIISNLYYIGKMHFMDLIRQMDGISTKSLSKELKDLEMNELITRTQKNTVPMTVEYELTDLGKSLHTIIDSMGDWGINYRGRIIT